MNLFVSVVIAARNTATVLNEFRNAGDIITRWSKFYQASYSQCEQSGKAENEPNVGVRVIRPLKVAWERG